MKAKNRLYFTSAKIKISSPKLCAVIVWEALFNLPQLKSGVTSECDTVQVANAWRCRKLEKNWNS